MYVQYRKGCFKMPNVILKSGDSLIRLIDRMERGPILSNVNKKRLGGNALVRQAKKVVLDDVAASNEKKRNKNLAIINGILGVVNSGFSIWSASLGNVAGAIFNSIGSIFCSTVAGINLTNFLNAGITKLETEVALNGFLSHNQKDLMKIINRYLQNNGKKEITAEQLYKAYLDGNMDMKKLFHIYKNR